MTTTPDRIRNSQRRILMLLREKGPMTDDEIFECGVDMSESGARTRRSELVTKELVVDSGKRKCLSSGRKSIVWAAADGPFTKEQMSLWEDE